MPSVKRNKMYPRLQLLIFKWLPVGAALASAAGIGLYAGPAGAARDTVHLTAPHQQIGSGQFVITTVSSRNDLISGDSALVRVGVPPGSRAAPTPRNDDGVEPLHKFPGRGSELDAPGYRGHARGKPSKAKEREMEFGVIKGREADPNHRSALAT
jgi:hypothetical protein